MRSPHHIRGRCNQPMAHPPRPAHSVAPLISDLQSKFHGAIQIPTQQVETFIQDKTPYLRKHMGEALTQLESSGRLKVAQFKSDGKRRRSGTYPNDALLSFEEHSI